MRYKAWVVVVVIIVLVIIAAAYGATHLTISALPEPGRFETSVATKARNWYIGRASRGSLPPAPVDDAANISQGETMYGMACASCHGQDARKVAPIGHSMYPRVPDLGSPEVQSMSDQELFWVIKHGIRFSGMPGFARISSDEEIWQLAYYVRSLGTPPKRTPAKY